MASAATAANDQSFIGFATLADQVRNTGEFVSGRKKQYFKVTMSNPNQQFTISHLIFDL